MKRLAWVTVFFTFLLMTWGNLVSATGSGLACPDWPLCHGTIVPPARVDIFFEWGHRLLAFTTTVLIIIFCVGIFRNANLRTSLQRPIKILAFLLVSQILLGAVTVLLELSVSISTIHLVIASIVFGILIAMATLVSEEAKSQTRAQNPAVSHQIKWGHWVLFSVLIQFLLGALTRHTHAGLACPNFPNCLDGWLPVPLTFETAVAFTHRWWAFFVFAIVLRFVFRIANTQEFSKLRTLARLTGGLTLLQVALGIATVLTELSTFWRAIHAALGYGIWGLLVFLAVQTGSFKGLWTSPLKRGVAQDRAGLATTPAASH